MDAARVSVCLALAANSSDKTAPPILSQVTDALKAVLQDLERRQHSGWDWRSGCVVYTRANPLFFFGHGL
jgi:hypothetical protein